LAGPCRLERSLRQWINVLRGANPSELRTANHLRAGV